jgi:Leucine-rich repeat (LRR) protein
MGTACSKAPAPDVPKIHGDDGDGENNEDVESDAEDDRTGGTPGEGGSVDGDGGGNEIVEFNDGQLVESGGAVGAAALVVAKSARPATPKTGLLRRKVAHVKEIAAGHLDTVQYTGKHLHTHQLEQIITAAESPDCCLTELDLSRSLHSKCDLAAVDFTRLNHLAGLKLNLSGNRLPAGPPPPSLGGCTALSELKLHANNFTGEFPDCLFQLLFRLDAFSTNGNDFEFEANSTKQYFAWECVAIKTEPTFQLNNRGLVGCIPHQLGECLLLTRLVLAGNALTGEIPSELGGLPALEHLDLSRNQLEGTLPKSLEECGALEYLDTSYNEAIEGPGLDMALLGQLHYFSFKGCRGFAPGTPIPAPGEEYAPGQVVAAYPPLSVDYRFGAMSNLRDLVELNVRNLGLTKVMRWDVIMTMSNLEELVLGKNPGLDASAIPADIGAKLPALRLVYLEEMNLMGPLPDFTNCANLTKINVARNKVSGGIPEHLTRCTSLVEVNLYRWAAGVCGVC